MSYSPRAKWVLFLLVFLNIINMVDRNLISSFGPQITEELGLSDRQFGLLTGIYFVFFYAIMGLFVGRLADRANRSKLIAAGLFLWSALTIFSGAAKNFFQIGVARLGIGVGEACLSPSAMSMLSDLFPANKRGMASGLYYLGVPLGAGASFIIAGYFGPKIGWRNCFYVLGAIGLVLVPLVYFLKDPERGAQETDETLKHSESSSLIDSISQVWRIAKESPALAWAMIGAIFMHLPLGAGQFAILWLVRERGFEAAEIAINYGLLFVLFGTIGSLIGGFASDWYQRRFKGGRLRFLVYFLLAVTPLMVSYRFVEPGSFLFYMGMSMGFLSFTAFYGPVFSTVQDMSPAKLRGVTTAILILMCNLVGLGLGAVAVGVLSEVFQSMQMSNPLTLSLLSIDLLGIFTVLSFFIGSVYWQKQFGDDRLAEKV